MSVSYKFTVVRKADKKKIATFYDDGVKAINYSSLVDQTIDFEEAPTDYGGKAVPMSFTVYDIESDIKLFTSKIEAAYDEVIKRTILLASPQSLAVKEVLEQDILDIKSEIKDLVNARDAYIELEGEVRCVVEGLVIKKDGSDDSHMACHVNAEGLDGSNSIFVEDVLIEVVCV